MNLCSSLVVLVTHGEVLKGSWKPGSLALVALLLLDPSDVQDLEDDDYPEDDPDDQYSLKCKDLENC